MAVYYPIIFPAHSSSQLYRQIHDGNVFKPFHLCSDCSFYSNPAGPFPSQTSVSGAIFLSCDLLKHVPSHIRLLGLELPDALASFWLVVDL